MAPSVGRLANGVKTRALPRSGEELQLAADAIKQTGFLEVPAAALQQIPSRPLRDAQVSGDVAQRVGWRHRQRSVRPEQRFARERRRRGARCAFAALGSVVEKQIKASEPPRDRMVYRGGLVVQFT